MSSRKVYSENEKKCLKDLVVKYKLHKSSSLKAASQSVKKVSWRRLTEDYNSIATNTKRTEAQLKKCYDNLKTRQKMSFIAKARSRRRIRTVRDLYTSNDESQSQLGASTDPLRTDAVCDLTDEKIRSVNDCDSNASADNIKEEVMETLLNEIPQPQDTPLPHDTTPRRVSPLRQATLSRASRSPLQGSINVCSKMNEEEEFRFRSQIAREIKERREDELHKTVMKEKEWMVMAAKESYFKAKAMREAAEELLRCRRAERQLAEYELKNKSKSDEI